MGERNLDILYMIVAATAIVFTLGFYFGGEYARMEAIEKGCVECKNITGGESQ